MLWVPSGGRECFRGGPVGGSWGAAVAGAVGSVFVVVLLEPVELVLQLGECLRGRLRGEEPFQGLVEPFDFPLGLRVAGRAVLLLHAQQGQEVFEGVASAAESGGVNPAVVGEGRGGCPMFVDRGEEGGDDVIAGDRSVSGAGDQVSRVVVEPVQDLDIAAVRESPVGEVGLPGLVRLGGFEADVRGLRAFLRLRGDEWRLMAAGGLLVRDARRS